LEKLEDEHNLNSKKMRISRRVNMPYELIRFRSLFPVPVRLYSKRMSKTLCENSGWYPYRSEKAELDPKDKRIVLTFGADYEEDTMAPQKILPC